MASQSPQPGGGLPAGIRPCPRCGNPVAYDALFCPNCGFNLQKRRPDYALIAAGVLAVAVGVLVAVLLTRDNNNGVATTTPTTLTQTIPTATTPTITITTTTVPTTPVIPPQTTPPQTTPAQTTPPQTQTTPAFTVTRTTPTSPGG